MAKLDLDPTKTAVLCLDMHNFTVDHVPEPQRGQMLAATRRVLDGARAADVTLIYVGVGRRPDFSSSRNKFTSAARPAVSAAEQAERMKFAPAIAPGENDPVVRKPRMNAFYSSELQSMLNARSVDTLVLSGVSTGFVVESTARYAVDADYRVIVLEDCCGASSAEDHARAIASMTPLVHVASSDDFLASLG